MNKNLIISLSLLILLAAGLYRPVWAQAGQDSDYVKQLAAVANLERIRAQVQLAEKSLDQGDRDGAFTHAFISHTPIFPSVKASLESIDLQNLQPSSNPCLPTLLL